MPPGHRADPVAQPRSVRHRAYLDACGSVFVFVFFLLGFWICGQNGALNPKTWFQTMSKNHPKMESKTANLTPKQVQNYQDGAKMAKKVPGTGFSRFREVFRAKNSSKMEAKMVQKLIKNSIKKRLFFDAGSGSMFS